MSTSIFVEGGGDRHDTIRNCREGFGRLFDKITKPGRRPHVVVCGGRDRAFRKFCSAVGEGQSCLLLVDSEDPVNVAEAWAHLSSRDGWERPAQASEESAHLMVQCMESWFLADRQLLVDFFGNGFRLKALPGNPNIEQISKVDILNGITNASHESGKGVYHKTRHGFELLGKLDFVKVEQVSPFAKRLHDAL